MHIEVFEEDDVNDAKKQLILAMSTNDYDLALTTTAI